MMSLTSSMKKVLAVAVIAVALTGCAKQPEVRPEDSSPVEVRNEDGTKTFTSDSAENGPWQGFTAANVELPDGRVVVCVYLGDGYRTGLSCDYDHPIDTPAE